MGSGINFVNMHPWGDFVGEQILAADGLTLDVQNIPAGYKWLIVLLCAKLETGKPGTTGLVRLNNDSTATHYTFLKMYGEAGDVFHTAFVTSSAIYGPNLNSANFASCQIQISQIPDGLQKSYWLAGGDGNQTFTTSGLWGGIVEINQVTIFAASGDKLKAGSQVMIYGVR